MRTISIAVLSLSLVAGAASAKKPSYVPTTEEQADLVPLKDLEGTYQISNGRVLHLTVKGNQLFVAIDKDKPREFALTLFNVYVPTGGDVMLRVRKSGPLEYTETGRKIAASKN